MSEIIPYETTDKLTLKQRMWLKSYLNCFNGAQAARDAKYNCDNEVSYSVIGAENFAKLRKIIGKWIDEVGMSEEAIKAKILQGFTAKETKFFTHLGIVTEEKEVEALGIQQRYTDMAAKVKGIYAAEKRDITVETYEERLQRLMSEGKE